MRGWGTFLFLAAVSTWAPAIASTELHVGSGPAGGLFQQAPAADPRDGPAGLQTQPDGAQAGSAVNDATPSGDDAYDVDVGTLLGSNISVARYDRFNSIFILIAFAGLTAVFAGKRSRGRGLITG